MSAVQWKRIGGEWVATIGLVKARVFRDVFRRWTLCVDAIDHRLWYYDTMRDARAAAPVIVWQQTFEMSARRR